MSSDEDYDGTTTTKGSLVSRVCDGCRQRNARCDGRTMPNGKRCSTCLVSNLECTYGQPAKKRSNTTRKYVQTLEARLEKMEELMKEINANGSSKRTKGSCQPIYVAVSPSSSEPSISSLPSSMQHASSSSATSPQADEESGSSDEEPLFSGLTEYLERLQLDPTTPRYHGNSAPDRTLKDVMGLKERHTRQLRSDGQPLSMPTVNGRPLRRRPEFWGVQPWETQGLDSQVTPAHDLVYEFPPDDLLPALIDRYFEEFNVLLPLLYRPGFEKKIAEGLHLTNERFAAVLLLVSAIGSAFVDDLRVKLNGARFSNGWKYFNQVHLVRKSLLAPPTLYDMQIIPLAVMFLKPWSLPEAYWSLLGLGLRMAQDIGLHRKKTFSRRPDVQEEQWKRAFWVMVTLDRGTSMGLGRSVAIQDEDIDVDLPLEVDAEYWEDPQFPFKQPAGKPARETMFAHILKLRHVTSLTARTIYAVRKSKILYDQRGPEWERKVVSHLDSSLNEWLDSVPDHLRWDPKREDPTFFYQSAHLYIAYYNAQISIHRPFIPQSRKPNALGLPSLTICTNAARTSSRVLEAVNLRREFTPVQTSSAFHMAIILLLNVWGPAGLALDPNKEMADIQRCMDLLKTSEKQWYVAGRFWDILADLTSTEDGQFPTQPPREAGKRKRSGDTHSIPNVGGPSSGIRIPAPHRGEHAQPGRLEVSYLSASFIPAAPLHAGNYGHSAGQAFGADAVSIPDIQDFASIGTVPQGSSTPWWPAVDSETYPNRAIPSVPFPDLMDGLSSDTLTELDALLALHGSGPAFAPMDGPQLGDEASASPYYSTYIDNNIGGQWLNPVQSTTEHDFTQWSGNTR